jgi:hypothetical protein
MTVQKTIVRKGPRALLQDARAAASGPFAAHGFGNPQLILRWRDFAGPALGQMSAPLSLTPDGLLTISADPSVALFLQHQTATIVQRVNLALGPAVVRKVKVVKGRFAKPSMPPVRRAPSAAERDWVAVRVSGAKDPELRAALERLGQAVLIDRSRAKAPR